MSTSQWSHELGIRCDREQVDAGAFAMVMLTHLTPTFCSSLGLGYGLTCRKGAFAKALAGGK